MAITSAAYSQLRLRCCAYVGTPTRTASAAAEVLQFCAVPLAWATTTSAPSSTMSGLSAQPPLSVIETGMPPANSPPTRTSIQAWYPGAAQLVSTLRYASPSPSVIPQSAQTTSPSWTRLTPTATSEMPPPASRTSMLASSQHPAAGVTDPSVAQPLTCERSAAWAPVSWKPKIDDMSVMSTAATAVGFRTRTPP